MRAVVIGNGVASLACIRSLQKYNSSIISKISHISGAPKHSSSSSSSSSSSFYTGLWNSPFSILENLLDSNNVPPFSSVDKSCYLNAQGHVLAQPEIGLKPFCLGQELKLSASTPSLSFCKNTDLLNSLRSSIKDCNDNCCYEEIYEDAIDIQSKASSKKVILTSGSCIDADLVIVADGMFSHLRHCIINCSHHQGEENITNQNHSNGADEGFLEHRGYKVYRGHTTERISDLSFQSWGPSARFACVPTMEGNAWFAACSSSPQSASMHVSAPFLANDNDNDNGNDGDNRPFSNGGREGVSKKEWDCLVNTFRSWHPEVSQILHKNSALAQTSVTEAFAFRSTETANSINAKIGIHSNTSIADIADVNNYNYTSVDRKAIHNGVVFIGDANYVIDPILAQGAGVAIEDSYFLSQALSFSFSTSPSSSIAEHKLDMMNRLERSIQLFDKERREKIRRLFHLSNLSQYIGHIDSPILSKIRNVALILTPQPVKGKVFDYFIGLSAR